MADYTVKLIITNNENQQNLSSECTVGEETAEKVWKDFHSDTHSIPFLGLDEIR